MSEQVVLNSLCVGKIDVLSTSADGDIDYFDISSVDNANKRIIAHQTMRAKDAPSRAKQLVRTDDILVSTVRPNLNAVAMVNSNTGNTMVASTGFCVLRANARADPHYLFHFVQSSRFVEAMVSQATGASYPAVSNSIVKNCSIPLRDLPTQRRIATTLDKVSEGIDLCRKMLGDLDKLVKSQFIEMFGETRTNSKRWKTALLESIASVGSSKRVFVEELKKQGIPFFRGTEVGALATGEKVVPELYITEEHYQVLKEATGVPVIGDLLMPSICPDGRIWMVDTDEPFYFKDGRVLWVHPTDDTIDSCYLLHVLKNTIMTDYGSIASGTTFAELKIFALKALSVMLPPMELQKQFATFIAQADKSKYAVQQQLAELETLKKSLMQEYFG